MKLNGKMSTFGGPKDMGVKPNEGVALVNPSDLSHWWFAHLFLSKQPPGTTGLARRLNPDAYYVACRWNYKLTPRSKLRNALVKLSAGGKTIWARPVDWGPNVKTGRIADLSPGAADALSLDTDDIVEVELVL